MSAGMVIEILAAWCAAAVCVVALMAGARSNRPPAPDAIDAELEALLDDLA